MNTLSFFQNKENNKENKMESLKKRIFSCATILIGMYVPILGIGSMILVKFSTSLNITDKLVILLSEIGLLVSIALLIIRDFRKKTTFNNFNIQYKISLEKLLFQKKEVTLTLIYFLHNLETKKDITSFDIEDEITSFHNFTCSDWVPVKIKRLSKAYNLMDKIYCPETIKMEYKRIEDGKSYGIDQPVYEFIDSIKILTTEESGNLLDIINKIKDIDLMDTPIIRLERYNDFMSDINRKLIDFTLFVCIPGKYSSDNKKFVSSSDESIISSEPTTK